MAYVALYRQWRPQDFDNLVGQEHISITLKNAIQSDKIAHAYLFAGPRGTGKTSTAKILAKALNCDEGPTAHPCNKCDNCERITSGTSMDVYEIDAASNRGIDEIRDLRETVKFAPTTGRYKIYIIDEVHMLTTEAFNALLKTLEEPPAHVVFILATTEPHKIPATIHSRCQRYDFRRIAIEDIVQRLQKVVAVNSFEIEEEGLTLIAMHADGGMRDALSLLDQCSALATGMVTAEHVRNILGLIGHEWIWQLTDALAKKDVVKALNLLDQLITMGKDVRQILLELAEHLRCVMLYKAAPSSSFTQNLKIVNEDVIKMQAAMMSHSELVTMIQMLYKAANEIKWAPEPRVVAEMTFISICQQALAMDIVAISEKLAQLENRIARGAINYSPERQVTTAQEVTKRVLQPSIQEAPEKTDFPKKNKPVSGELEGIWQKVLKQLVAEGKRSIHACVAQGRLVLLEDNSAEVRFTGRFPKERTEKDDYLPIIEKTLSAVCNKNIKIQCSLSMETPAAKSGGKKLAAEKTQDHPVLRQAQEMFGGKILEQNEED